MRIDFLKKFGDKVSRRLYEIISNQSAPQILKDAMLYSIDAGGKRLRPALMLEFYDILGGNTDEIIDIACAVEMIHTYSLIHDDLPCMDNDDMRRGKPSCHIAFGEDIALLAGDALLTLAFESASNIKSKNALLAVNCLAKAAGMCGMCAGQALDLQSENKIVSAETLKSIHEKKTTAMIKVNAQIACILADADSETVACCERYCDDIGLAFQIRDDVLDVIGDEKKLGKHLKSDNSNNKNTYVSFYGLGKCKDYIKELTDDAVVSIAKIDKNENLQNLARFLAERDF